MSYTNVELVKQHLIEASPVMDRIHNQVVTLGTDTVTFFNGAVEESSVIAKSLHQSVPTRTQVTLGSSWTSVDSVPIVDGSVVVASDSSLGTIYQEQVDYVFDCRAADMVVKNGGLLSIGQTVTIWYLPYHVHVSGTDFTVTAVSGRIRRLSGGNIAAGEQILLDYAPVVPNFGDELLSKAVLEANAMIEREVDPEGQFGADPLLETAATYRALEIVCRSSAARELARRQGEDRVALAWMKLAETFAARAHEVLRSFRPPFTSPSAPIHG
jgi:hypothetical protein